MMMYLERAQQLAKQSNYTFDKFMPVWSAEIDTRCRDVLSEIDRSVITGSDLEVYITMNYMFWLALNNDDVEFDKLYYFSIYSRLERSTSKTSKDDHKRSSEGDPKEAFRVDNISSRATEDVPMMNLEFGPMIQPLDVHLHSTDVNKYMIYMANSKYYHVINPAIKSLVSEQPDWLFRHVVVDNKYVVYNPIGTMVINYISQKISLLCSVRTMEDNCCAVVKYEIELCEWPSMLHTLFDRLDEDESRFIRHVRLLRGTELYRCLIDTVGYIASSEEGASIDGYIYLLFDLGIVERFSEFIVANNIRIKSSTFVPTGQSTYLTDIARHLNSQIMLTGQVNEIALRTELVMLRYNNSVHITYGYNKQLRYPWFIPMVITAKVETPSPELMERLMVDVSIINHRHLHVKHLICHVCLEHKEDLNKCSSCNGNYCGECIENWARTTLGHSHEDLYNGSSWYSTTIPGEDASQDEVQRTDDEMPAHISYGKIPLSSYQLFMRCMGCLKIYDINYTKIPYSEINTFMRAKLNHYMNILDMNEDVENSRYNLALTNDIHTECQTDDGTQICRCGTEVYKSGGCNHIKCTVCGFDMVWKPTKCDKSSLSYWNIEMIKDVRYVTDMFKSIQTVEDFVHDYKIYFVDRISVQKLRSLLEHIRETNITSYNPGSS